MKFLYKNYCLLSDSEIEKTAQLLLPYTASLQKVVGQKNYQAPEASLCLPDDTDTLLKVEEILKKIDYSKLKYIIDIGIGGSNLGTKAIYDSLFGFFDVVYPDRIPKMFFADTNDPEFLSSITSFIETAVKSKEEVIVNAISKSGGTTETTANADIILNTFSRKFGDVKDRVVVTTDKGSKLWEKADKLNFLKLAIPKLVGGRYSVFSAVGLFPLAAVGINIKSLLQGAKEQLQKDLSGTPEENAALTSAIILYLHNQKGININDNFFFDQELESVGKWYRQLMGESLGKDGKGITPTVSIGSTDLHSVGQLYLGGPKDKLTTFVSVENHPKDAVVPADGYLGDLTPMIKGKKTSQIMKAILEGVKIAYQNQNQPFTNVLLNDLSEKSLGEYLQFKMTEMMYLGKLLKVNPFDQPHVELYKVETKKILTSS